MNKLEAMIRRHEVPDPEGLEQMTCLRSPYRYIRANSEGNVLICLGLNKEDGAVLINSQNGLDRQVIDTLHDLCLFTLSSNSSKDFYQEGITEMTAELKSVGITPPEKSDMYWAVGRSYPGSWSFAFELNGKLVIT